MSSPSSQAPIASPHGAGQPYQPAPIGDQSTARLVVLLPLAAVCRYSIMEWINPCVLLLIVFIPIWGALLLRHVSAFKLLTFPVLFCLLLPVFPVVGIPFSFLFRFLSRRLFRVQISSDGLSRMYRKRKILFSWRRFYWIIERKGDMWLASFADGCFIPREAFASPEEAREFAAIVRSLKGSSGDSWLSEWDGRVFGVQPDEPVTPVGG